MYPPDTDDVLHALTLAARRVRGYLDREMRSSGATDAQYQVLRVLIEARGKPIPKSEIAKELHLTDRAVAEALERLRAVHAVRMEKAPGKGNAVFVQIRAEGRDLAKATAQKRTEILEKLLEVIYDEDIRSGLKGALEELAGAASR